MNIVLDKANGKCLLTLHRGTFKTFIEGIKYPTIHSDLIMKKNRINTLVTYYKDDGYAIVNNNGTIRRVDVIE
jgi:hypothetical protein